MQWTSLSIFTVIIFAGTFLCSITDAKLIMTVIMNDGIFPTPEGYFCDENDTRLINSVIGGEEYGADKEDVKDDDDEDDDEVGDGDEVVEEVDEDVDGRGRRLKSKECKDACSGSSPGSCHVTDCKSRRNVRSLLKRKLLDDEIAKTCAIATADLNLKLDLLAPELSKKCRPAVKYQRSVKCFDNVRFAAVNSYNIWNAIDETIVHGDIQNNTEICYTDGVQYNIEAVANGCVHEITIAIHGGPDISTSSAIMTSAPFMAFGYDTTTGDLHGHEFPVGTYTISAVLHGSNEPNSDIVFTVKKC